MPWVRFTNQPTLSYSNLTGFYGTVVYKAWDIDRNDIVVAPERLMKNPGGTSPGDTETLPGFDTPWPFGSSVDESVPTDRILLDDYTVSKNGTEFVIVALYTDRRYRNTFAASFQTKQDDVQYQLKRPIVLAKSQGSGNSASWAWVNYAAPVFSTIARASITKHVKVNYTPGEAGPSQFLRQFSSVINAQTNRLHYLGVPSGSSQGSRSLEYWFRFEGADIVQIAWDRFKVSYSWVHDSGNLADYSSIFIPGSDPTQSMLEINLPKVRSSLEEIENGPSDTVGKWFRAPFEQTIAVPPMEYFGDIGQGSFDPTKPPPNVYISRQIFKVDATGWASLPGFDDSTSPL